MSPPTEAPPSIFVVGSSRSRTTMMGRILNRHPEVYTFHELHFFEEMWSPESEAVFYERKEAERVMARLLSLERGEGYLGSTNPDAFLEEAHRRLDTQGLSVPLFPLEVYRAFLFGEAKEAGASIPCEQTPRNSYYVGEILEHFPDARVVHMVRDPRDVLLSQKRKWKRHFLGATNIPLTEALRSWFNYHPITISRLWRSSVETVQAYRDHPRVLAVHFEDILDDSEATVRDICQFVGIEYEKEMLAVRQVGSSNQQDRPEERGIDKNRSGNWREGGLTETEVFWCQKLTSGTLEALPYSTEEVHPNPLALALSSVYFPLKLGVAFLLNLSRMNSIVDTLRRRLRIRTEGT